jgi:hypothetical protein
LAGEPSSVKLSGKVRSEKGSEDAEERSQDFLESPELRIENGIELDASLGLRVTSPEAP